MKSDNKKETMRIMQSIGVAGLWALVAGCAAFGSDPSPPSKFEQAHYDIITNVQPLLVIRTNVVSVTNQVVETLTLTNTLNEVVHLFQTNYVPQFIALYSTNTVQHETYSYRPNTNAEAITNGAAQLGQFSGVPGIGSIISIAGGALWGLWGTLRSSGRGKALAVVSQSLATTQQVLAKTPQGARLNEELQAWLDQHHEVAGVSTILNQFVDKYVDDPNARANAHQILALAQAPPAPTS